MNEEKTRGKEGVVQGPILTFAVVGAANESVGVPFAVVHVAGGGAADGRELKTTELRWCGAVRCGAVRWCGAVRCGAVKDGNVSTHWRSTRRRSDQ